MTLKWKIPCSWTYPSPPQPPCLTDPHVIHPLEGIHWCYWWSAKKKLSLKAKEKELFTKYNFPFEKPLGKVGYLNSDPGLFGKYMAWAKHQEQLCNRRDGGEESPSPATVFSERENGWHGWSKYCWWVVTDHFFFKTSVKAHYVPNVYVCQGKCISYVYLQLYACDCVRSFDFLEHLPQYLHANICR